MLLFLRIIFYNVLMIFINLMIKQLNKTTVQLNLIVTVILTRDFRGENIVKIRLLYVL